MVSTSAVCDWILNSFLTPQVGETGHTVGVEHISELASRSIEAIKLTPAGPLLEKGHLVVHGNHLQPTL